MPVFTMVSTTRRKSVSSTPFLITRLSLSEPASGAREMVLCPLALRYVVRSSEIESALREAMEIVPFRSRMDWHISLNWGWSETAEPINPMRLSWVKPSWMAFLRSSRVLFRKGRYMKQPAQKRHPLGQPRFTSTRAISLNSVWGVNRVEVVWMRLISRTHLF